MYSMVIMLILVVVAGWFDSRMNWDQNKHTAEKKS